MASNHGYLTSEEARHVERSHCQPGLGRSVTSVERLEVALEEVFADPTLTPDAAEELRRELEDLLIGRLELEQPMINVELLARVMARSLVRLSKSIASEAIGQMAQKAALLLAAIFPALGPLTS